MKQKYIAIILIMITFNSIKSKESTHVNLPSKELIESVERIIEDIGIDDDEIDLEDDFQSFMNFAYHYLENNE